MAHALRRAKLVAFAGIDGSGKTSQARLISDWLTSHGYATYLQAADGPSSTRQALADLAAQLGLESHLDVLGAETTRFVNALVRLADWQRGFIPAMDVVDVVVIDRYVSCFYASARALRLGNEHLMRMLFRNLPRPDVTIYLDTPPGVAQQRLIDRATDSESLAYLSEMSSCYATLPEYPDFVPIDGAEDQGLVQERIAGHLRASLPVAETDAGLMQPSRP
jgi:dTMP kinase